MIIGMVDRIFKLSHPKFHQNNLYLTIQTLLNNSYPLNFIFNTIETGYYILYVQKTLKALIQPIPKYRSL